MCGAGAPTMAPACCIIMATPSPTPMDLEVALVLFDRMPPTRDRPFSVQASLFEVRGCSSNRAAPTVLGEGVRQIV